MEEILRNIFESYNIGININPAPKDIWSELTGKYSVYAWGAEHNGNMGSTKLNGSSEEVTFHSTPVKLPFTCDDIELGNSDNLIIKCANNLYSLGGGRGILGIEPLPTRYDLPVKIFTGTNIKKYQFQFNYNIIILDGTNMYTCGNNSWGSLNTGDNSTVVYTWQLQDINVLDIATNCYGLAYLKEEGLYKCGRIFIGDTEVYNNTLAFESTNIKELVPYPQSVLGLTKDNPLQAYVFGQNGNYRFTTANVSTEYNGTLLNLFDTEPLSFPSFTDLYQNQGLAYIDVNHDLKIKGDLSYQWENDETVKSWKTKVSGVTAFCYNSTAPFYWIKDNNVSLQQVTFNKSSCISSQDVDNKTMTKVIGNVGSTSFGSTYEKKCFCFVLVDESKDYVAS